MRSEGALWLRHWRCVSLCPSEGWHYPSLTLCASLSFRRVALLGLLHCSGEPRTGKRLGATLEIMATSPRATIDIDDDEDVDLEKDRSPTELADDDGSDDKEDDQLGVLAHPCEAGGGGDGDQRGEGMQVESENIYLGALGEVDGTTAISPPPGIKDNRKRGRSHAERELKEEQDEEESESPSKKASTDAAPVSGRELRALLASHLLEMKGQIGNRISQVEAAQQRQAQEVVNLQGKTITVEKEIMNLKGRHIRGMLFC